MTLASDHASRLLPAAEVEHLAAVGNPAGQPDQVAAEGGLPVLPHVQTQLPADRLEPGLAGHAHRAIRPTLDGSLGCVVVLVVDVTDNLLEDILDRDDSDCCAELVHQQGHVLTALAHVREQLVEENLLRGSQQADSELNRDEEGVARLRDGVGE